MVKRKLTYVKEMKKIFLICFYWVFPNHKLLLNSWAFKCFVYLFYVKASKRWCLSSSCSFMHFTQWKSLNFCFHGESWSFRVWWIGSFRFELTSGPLDTSSELDEIITICLYHWEIQILKFVAFLSKESRNMAFRNFDVFCLWGDFWASGHF